MEDGKSCPVHKQGVQSFHKRDTGNCISHGYDLGYEDAEKQEKDWLQRQGTASALCPQTASFDPLPFDHSCAPGNWLNKDMEWQLLAANNIQQPLLVAHAHSTATGCTSMLFPCMLGDTVATYSPHSLRRWSHKQPLTCNTYKSNLPLGFQFSVWICSPLSLHQREAGSSF